MFSLAAVIVTAQFITTLGPKTIEAFDQYLRTVETEMTRRAAAPKSDAKPTSGVFSNVSGKEISHGMLNDWTAVAFVPGARLDKAVEILEDFSGHPRIYPEVTEGRIERRNGNQIFGFHRLKKKKVLEVTLDVRYQLDVLPSVKGRYASRSAATEIAEVENPGTPKEHKLTPGHDHGFLWRLVTFWLLNETREGLWMECRTVSLSRDTPVGLGWAIRPIVKDLPKESLEALMEANKRAILAAK